MLRFVKAIFNSNSASQKNSKTLNVSLLQALNEPNSVMLKANVDDWKGAIKIIANMLLADKAVDEFYYDDLTLKLENKLNDYIIVKGVALAHNHKNSHILKNKIVFLGLKKPIQWGDQKVSYIICLTDLNDQYITMMTHKQIATVFALPNIVEILNQFTTSVELLNFIEKMLILAK